MFKILLCDNGNVENVAPFAKERNLGIEVQAFHDPDKLSLSVFEDYEKVLSGINLRSLHGPFGDLNPGSHDEKIRVVTRERFEEGFSAALRLKINNIVLHNGYVPGTRPLTRWIPQSINFWKEFIRDKQHMIFHIENMLELSPDILDEVITGIDSPKVDVCLDIGHAHCNSQKSVVEWIQFLKNKIGYVHIHDNHGETDEHLGLGKGTIPLLEVFSALKQFAPNAIWAMEAEGDGLLQSLDWLQQNRIL